MKTVKRKISTNKTFYIADDGIEFESKSECLIHEMRCAEKSLELFTHKFERSNIGECTYANLPTKESVETFLSCCHYDGYHAKGVENPGLYMYSNNEWINLTEVLEKLSTLCTKVAEVSE